MLILSKNKTLKRAKKLLGELRSFQKKHAHKLEKDVRDNLASDIALLEDAISQNKPDLDELCDKLEKLFGHISKPYRKSLLREYVESILFALVVALFFRTFIVEPFKIPSGSMIPTLAIGDHIFVNKLAYGIWIPFKKKKFIIGHGPKRGDVIVFAYPNDPKIDFIKRVVGIPGDRIELKGQDLYINGKLIPKKRGKHHHYKEWDETTKRWELQRGVLFTEDLFGARHQIMHSEGGLYSLDWSSAIDAPRLKHRAWGPIVKKGFVFVMGDNRDFSSDSRSWGLVPLENIKGEAFFIWISVGGGSGIHWKRFFSCIPPHRGFFCLQ